MCFDLDENDDYDNFFGTDCLLKSVQNLMILNLRHTSDFFNIVGLVRQLILRQLIQSNLKSQLVVRSQLCPRVHSGPSPFAILRMVTQSTHFIDCNPQLVSTLHYFKNLPPKQLVYRCFPFHSVYCAVLITTKVWCQLYAIAPSLLI